MPVEIIEKELSYQIIKAAFEVHNSLGPGFLESLYEEAMAFELKSQGLELERQKQVSVTYKGQVIGKHILDTVVNQKIILEYKAASVLIPLHEQQVLSYLKATGLPLGVLINFGTARVQYRRIVNTRGTSNIFPAHQYPATGKAEKSFNKA
jgi:GxxExxY protein